ncbi:hypothetical protein F4778DRAFT_730138 [Xylariomycetidae sp. FL2044]|nr:hypothetical protein F4778DRAFT_730138 [Xylariomycetidae sp. FL2044]
MASGEGLLAPLTTVFTPSCPITWLSSTTRLPSQNVKFPNTGPSSCDPPSWSSYLAGQGFYFYSPAICPSGFVVGPSCEITNPRTAQDFPAITSGETAVYCVVSGQTCTSDTTDFRGGVWGVTRLAGNTAVVGPAIQIRWREDDIPNLETHPLTPGLGAAATATVDEFTSPAASPTTVRFQTLPAVTTTPTATPRGYDTISPDTTSLDTVVSTDDPDSSPIIPEITTSEDLTTSPSTAPSPPSSTTDISQGQAAPSESEQPKSAGGGASNTSIAALVLTSVLIMIIAGFTSFLLVRRYRRYRAGEVAKMVPVGLGAWVRGAGVGAGRKWCVFGRGFSSFRSKAAYSHWPRGVDAELGTDGPTPELAADDPLGSKGNPAELESPDKPASDNRWSWVSRVSKRMLSVRLTKPLPSLPSSSSSSIYSGKS